RVRPFLELYTLSLHDALPISDLASQRPFGMFLGIGACVIKRARGKRKNFIVAIILHRLRRRQAEADRSRRQCGYIPTLEANRKRSEEHTSELQSLRHLVCRLL